MSVSICYDLCEVLKEDNDLIKANNCSDGNFLSLTLNQINSITWGDPDFKKRSSMR